MAQEWTMHRTYAKPLKYTQWTQSIQECLKRYTSQETKGVMQPQI